MKTNPATFFLAVLAIAAIAFCTVGCGKKKTETPAPVVTAIPASSAPGAPLVAVPAVSAGDWADLKHLTHDRRSELLAGLPGLEARVEAQVSELQALRAALPAQTDTRDWDFSMKEMLDARGYLKSMNAEMAKASRETWDEQKDKVGVAWARTQDAYSKVKTSTTIR
jgi:hypothetical protein